MAQLLVLQITTLTRSVNHGLFNKAFIFLHFTSAPVSFLLHVFFFLALEIMGGKKVISHLDSKETGSSEKIS